MSNVDSRFVFALLAAARGIESRLDGVLSNVKGISLTEYLLLAKLKKFHDSAATRVELARAVHLTPSAVTRALKPLEKIGYVATRTGERDARQSVATLTAAGEELLEDSDSLVLDEIATLPLAGSIGADWVQVLNGLAPGRY